MEGGTVYWRPTHVISSINVLEMLGMGFETKLENLTVIFPNPHHTQKQQ